MNYLQKGFTLIEVIIVVGIIGIVIAGSTRIYTFTVAERQLDKEADGLMNILQRAKDRTVARDVSSLPGCTNFVGYSVFIQSSGAFEERILCDLTSTTLDQHSLTNVVFNSLSPSPMQLTFTYPYGSLDTITRVIQIKSARINKCITITVPQLGPINMSDTFPC
ncbi:MAG: prepilin-type N-terminal cleavage/methylation domain-containing protein [bacterium]|nr:prepilin-type N-terminal cleavage/methylation domain-containing protein [bacterium]